MLRKVLRWARRIAIGLVALVTLAVLAVVILMHTAWGREQIRGRIEAALRDEFPGGAHIGALEGTVFGELVLKDVELDGIDHRPLATIKTLRIDLAILPLLGQTARIDHLIAEDVLIDARPQPPRPPPTSPSSWDVALEHVEVHRATVTIGEIALGDLEIVGSATLDAGAPITAAGAITGTWRRDRDHAVPITASGWLRYDDALALPLVTGSLGARPKQLAFTGANLDVARGTGTVAIMAPAEAIAALVPGIPFSDDVMVLADAEVIAGQTQIALFGAIGAARIQGTLRGAAGRGAGVVTIASSDLGRLTGGRIGGNGLAIAALAIDAPTIAAAAVHGAVSASGAIDGMPAGHALIAFDADARGARALAVASGDGALRTVATAALTRDGDRIAIDRADVVASARDLAAATAGRAAVGGAVDGAVVIRGPLLP
ncbi:MAG: hypothetical protein K8W52_07800, partial [Deltaproteobacteria bacterium]|nr:hypothetical protein [Deltaproteobacteria bacterium]